MTILLPRKLICPPKVSCILTNDDKTCVSSRDRDNRQLSTGTCGYYPLYRKVC